VRVTGRRVAGPSRSGCKRLHTDAEAIEAGLKADYMDFTAQGTPDVAALFAATPGVPRIVSKSAVGTPGAAKSATPGIPY